VLINRILNTTSPTADSGSGADGGLAVKSTANGQYGTTSDRR